MSYNIPCGAAKWPLCRCSYHLRRLAGVGALASCRIFVFHVDHIMMSDFLQEAFPKATAQESEDYPLLLDKIRQTVYYININVQYHGCFAGEETRHGIESGCGREYQAHPQG